MNETTSTLICEACNKAQSSKRIVVNLIGAGTILYEVCESCWDKATKKGELRLNV